MDEQDVFKSIRNAFGNQPMDEEEKKKRLRQEALKRLQQASAPMQEAVANYFKKKQEE